jgi:hypothetical protein
MKAFNAATMHRIDLTPASRRNRNGISVGRDASFVTYRGEVIGEFRCPLCEASRYLLDRGLAEPDDSIGAYRDGKLSMGGRVGVYAKLTVKETEKVGPVWAKFQPFPDRLAEGLASVAGSMGGLAPSPEPLHAWPEPPEPILPCRQTSHVRG